MISILFSEQHGCTHVLPRIANLSTSHSLRREAPDVKVRKTTVGANDFSIMNAKITDLSFPI